MQDPNGPRDPAKRPEPPGTNKAEASRETLMTQDQSTLIRELKKMNFGTRTIAKKVGVGRKVVRKKLAQWGMLKSNKPSSSVRPPSKIDPFRQQIGDKVNKTLTTTRILREIRKDGYTGGRTILADYVRQIRPQTFASKRVWRRFETPPGQETQYDWSPYRVMLGGVVRTVHAFAATLGFSRKSYVRFYLDERQPTLLEAHTLAFADFEGVTKRGVYDWMATVVLGTVGKDRQPLWHPRFLEFTSYYGYEPYLCKVRDPDRKGKDERVFWYMERDFLMGTEFDSLDHLNAEARIWLDEVANCRVHGTTRQVPDELWQQERPFLIPLPESRYPACSEEVRDVGPDAVLWIRGTPYTAPGQLASRTVSVRLYAEHFEVLWTRGDVIWSRRYVSESQKGKLVIDPNHYEGVHHRGPLHGGSAAKLDEAFVKRFPTLAPLVDGIKSRMKTLAHIHMRALWRLADRYGEDIFRDVAERVQAARRFDAHAVRRVLERDHAFPDEDAIEVPLNAAARVLVELGDVNPGSLDDYANLDSQQSGDGKTSGEDYSQERLPDTQDQPHDGGDQHDN